MSSAVQQPATWSAVAPLLARWQMALVPYGDGTWDVHAGYPSVGLPQHTARAVPFAGLPQAIADVAARCAACTGRDPVAAGQGEGEG